MMRIKALYWLYRFHLGEMIYGTMLAMVRPVSVLQDVHALSVAAAMLSADMVAK